MDKKKTSKGTTDSSKESSKRIGRRKAVRNILAASGLALGAPIAGHSLKTSINKKVTPARAQISTEGVVLVGHVNLKPVTNVDNDALSQASNASVLDFFIDSSYATMGPNLAGARMVMNIPDKNAFSLDVEFPDSQRINVLGTISNNSIKGSGHGVTVSGIVDLTAETPMAAGALSNGIDIFDFSLKMAALEQCEPFISTTPDGPSTTFFPTTPFPEESSTPPIDE